MKSHNPHDALPQAENEHVKGSLVVCSPLRPCPTFIAPGVGHFFHRPKLPRPQQVQSDAKTRIEVTPEVANDNTYNARRKMQMQCVPQMKCSIYPPQKDRMD